MTISNDSRARVKKVFEPIALAMGRAGLTPDGLTLIGFAITVVGAVLLGMQQWLIGGIVMFIGGVFDMFDGTLARATGQASPLGGFMDSVFDRAGEVVVYIGIVAGLLGAGLDEGALLAAATMGAAVMVSYARAKSDAHGFTAGMGLAAVGVMPREIRLVILSLGLIVGAILGIQGPCGNLFCVDQSMPGTSVLAIALWIILIGSIITVIQRIVFVRREAKTTTPTLPS
jgi:CDP-diacylglycerol--glycerol-3-phosphate 3-phosphatidyltransferase